MSYLKRMPRCRKAPRLMLSFPLPETADETILDAERQRVLEIMDRIAALPIEGREDPFSGADHDKVLYGKP